MSFINVENILKTKNPKLEKIIPGFVVKYLKRIVHEQEINDFLSRTQNVNNLEFVEECVKYLDLHSVIKGFEKVPSSGRYIFVANHPLGGLESLILMSSVSQKYENIVFFVNDILMEIKQFGDLFAPVNKHGFQSRESILKFNSLFKSDKQILYFPAGLCSRKINGQIKDLQWHKTFINKAIETQRDVIPVFVDGRNSNFFYNLSKIRHFFGIKANIEMLYLVDEMYKQRGNTISLTFKDPIPHTVFDTYRTASEWALYVKEIVYKNDIV